MKQAFELFWDATPGHHEIEDQVAEDRTRTCWGFLQQVGVISPMESPG
jgi:hypothetical protein